MVVDGAVVDGELVERRAGGARHRLVRRCAYLPVFRSTTTTRPSASSSSAVGVAVQLHLLAVGQRRPRSRTWPRWRAARARSASCQSRNRVRALRTRLLLAHRRPRRAEGELVPDRVDVLHQLLDVAGAGGELAARPPGRRARARGCRSLGRLVGALDAAGLAARNHWAGHWPGRRARSPRPGPARRGRAAAARERLRARVPHQVAGSACGTSGRPSGGLAGEPGQPAGGRRAQRLGRGAGRRRCAAAR